VGGWGGGKGVGGGVEANRLPELVAVTGRVVATTPAVVRGGGGGGRPGGGGGGGWGGGGVRCVGVCERGARG